MIPTEHFEQCELVMWFRQTYLGVRVLAIPNGGQRSIATAARLKAEGVCAGVPDLFIPAWKLWVEMKRQKGGSVSPEQKDWLAYLESVDYETMVCKGAEDAKKKIMNLQQNLLTRAKDCFTVHTSQHRPPETQMICFNDAELDAYYSKEESMGRRHEIAINELDGESLHPYCDDLIEYCKDYEANLITLEELGLHLLRARNSAVESAVEKME